MKKIVFLFALLIGFTCVYAQGVTKFFGIPADGYKSEMIQKFKAKGYRYDSYNDCLTVSLMVEM